MLNQEEIRILPQFGHGNFPVISAAILPEKKVLATLDDNNTLIFWDIRSGKQMRDVAFPVTRTIRSEAISRDFSFQANPDKPTRLQYLNGTLYAYGSASVYEIKGIYQPIKKVLDMGAGLCNGRLGSHRLTYTAIWDQVTHYHLQQYLVTMDKGSTHRTSFRLNVFRPRKDNIEWIEERAPNLLGKLVEPRSNKNIYFIDAALNELKQRAVLVYDHGRRYGLVVNTKPKPQIGFSNIKKRKLAIFSFSQPTPELITKFEIDRKSPYWLSREADFVLFVKGHQLMQARFDHISQSQSTADDDTLDLAKGSPVESVVGNLKEGLPKGEKFRGSAYMKTGPVRLEKEGQPPINTYFIAVVVQTSSGHVLQAWNLHTRKKILHWPLSQALQPLSFSVDGQYVALGSGTGPIYLWNLQNGAQERVFHAAMPKILNISLQKSEAGQEGSKQRDNVVNFAFANNSFYSLKFDQGIRFQRKKQWGRDVKEAITCQAGAVTALIEKDKANKVVLFRENEHSPYLPKQTKADVLKMALSPDGLYLAIILYMNYHGQNNIFIIDTTTFEELAKWKLPGAHSLAFHPQTNDLAVGSVRRRVKEHMHLYRWRGWSPGPEEKQPPVVTSFSLKLKWEENWSWSPPAIKVNFSEGGKYLIVQEHSIARTIAILREADREEGAFQELFPVGGKNATEAEDGDPPLRKFLSGRTMPLIFGEDEFIIFNSVKRLSFDVFKMKSLESWFLQQEASPSEPPEPYKQVKENLFKDARVDNYVVSAEPSLIYLWKKQEDGVYVVNWEINGAIAWLFPYNEEKFLMASRHNYYYTTADGFDLMAFQLGDDVFPSEQFDLIYNKPHRLLERMGILPKDSPVIERFEKAYEKRLQKLFEEIPNREDIIKIFKNLDLDGNKKMLGSLPTVEILNKNKISGSTDEPALSFCIRASDEKTEPTAKPQNLLRLNIYVNGVPIHGRIEIKDEAKEIKSQDSLPIHGKVEVAKKAREIKGRHGLNLFERASPNLNARVHLTLSAGMNKVDVSVTNVQGLESFRDTFYINYSGLKRKPGLYVITIGVDEYSQDKDKHLRFAKADAATLAETLASIAPDEYRMIHQPLVLEDEKVTREEVKARINTYLSGAEEDDRVVLFYSGHGLIDSKLDFYLATHDVDFANPEEQGIGLELLDDLLDNIRSRNKLILLDACHSGEIDKEASQAIEAAAEMDAEDDEFKSGDIGLEISDGAFQMMQELFVDLRRGSGAMMISASAGDQKAREREHLNHGVFTYTLLEALGAKTPESESSVVIPKGRIRISDLSRYLIERVPEIAGRSQRPSMRKENISNDWLLK